MSGGTQGLFPALCLGVPGIELGLVTSKANTLINLSHLVMGFFSWFLALTFRVTPGGAQGSRCMQGKTPTHYTNSSSHQNRHTKVHGETCDCYLCSGRCDLRWRKVPSGQTRTCPSTFRIPGVKSLHYFPLLSCLLLLLLLLLLFDHIWQCSGLLHSWCSEIAPGGAWGTR